MADCRNRYGLQASGQNIIGEYNCVKAVSVNQLHDENNPDIAGADASALL